MVVGFRVSGTSGSLEEIMMQDQSTRGIHPARRLAFTLTELLVVIGIIVVLIGLLVPALGAARKTAKKAVTESTMTVVTSAVQAFRTDNKRLPGYFSQQELAGVQYSGFTAMENAMLELAGGVVDSSTPVEVEKGIIEYTRFSNPIVVDTFSIGSADGPGYLTGTGKLIQKTALINQNFDDGSGLPSNDEELMPDILDGWGNPIALWVKDEFAGPAATFAALDSSAPARFYYSSNYGYYSTERQNGASLLNSRDNANTPILTMNALLGHAMFPDQADPANTPDQAKGDIVLHSAGSDGLFLENQADAITTVRYNYDPDSSDAGINTIAPSETTMDAFDDVVRASS